MSNIDLIRSKLGQHIDNIIGDDIPSFISEKFTWIHCYVITDIGWPRQNQLITFKGWTIILHGHKNDKDKHNNPYYSIWYENDDRLNEAKQIAYEFASIAGWFLRGFISITSMSGSGRCSLNIPKITDDEFSPNRLCNFNYIPQNLAENERVSLAFWREGLTLHGQNDGYAFLSFFKILEYNLGPTKRQVWIRKNIENPQHVLIEPLDRIKQLTEDPNRYLYESCRCAIAHANVSNEILDPDNPSDITRIRQSLPLMRALSMLYLSEELGIPTDIDAHSNRDNISIWANNATITTERLFGDETITDDVGLIVELEVWPSRKFKTLSEIDIRKVMPIGSEVMFILTDIKNFALPIYISLTTGRIRLDPTGITIRGIEAGGDPEVEIDIREVLACIYCNNTIDLKMPNGEYVSCEEYIPVNIDPGETRRSIQERIDYIKSLQAAKQTTAIAP